MSACTSFWELVSAASSALSGLPRAVAGQDPNPVTAKDRYGPAPVHAVSLIDSVLDDQHLVLVFEMLGHHDLLCRAACVSKRWAAVAQGADLWRRRIPTALTADCDAAAVQNPAVYCRLYGQLYCSSLLTNGHLRKSPSPRGIFSANQSTAGAGLGWDALPGWGLTLHGGQGWAWEPRPVGMGPNAEEAVPAPRLNVQEHQPQAGPYDRRGRRLRPCCVAASYGWCQLVQAVDLRQQLAARGVSEAAAVRYLDSSPTLDFSVHYGGRSDCGSEAQVRLVLDDGQRVLPPYVNRADYDYESPEKGALHAWDSGALPAPRGGWARLEARLDGYPAGARRVLVILQAKDNSFWAGHYGGKFSAPELRFAEPTRRQ